MSLRFIEEAISAIDDEESGRPVRVIDVGGGASPLVDGLLDRGGVEVCVVDVAASGMEHAKARLGQRADAVRWIVADATSQLGDVEDEWADIWHDRAAMHFLVKESDQLQYARNASRIIRPGGFAVIGAFGRTGPTSCSGLPVQRQDAASVAALLSAAATSDNAPFRVLREETEQHMTPWGAPQAFAWVLLRRE